MLAMLFLLFARWPAAPGPAEQADRVLVLKRRHELILLSHGKPLRSYPISLGRVPVGNKEREGDGRTPEGEYVVDRRNEQSSCHRALHLSYPNDGQRRAAQAAGVEPGGAIMIHGLKNGFGWVGRWHRLFDWTRGCVALTDAELDQVWSAVPDGTPIELRP